MTRVLVTVVCLLVLGTPASGQDVGYGEANGTLQVTASGKLSVSAKAIPGTPFKGGTVGMSLVKLDEPKWFAAQQQAKTILPKPVLTDATPKTEPPVPAVVARRESTPRPQRSRIAPKVRRTFVLLVGCNDYTDPNIPALRFAENDARQVYGFYATDANSPTERDRVMVLLGAKATRRGLLKAIREQLIKKATEPTDAAILYFAGHGFSDANETYLACHDTELDDLMETSIPLSTLQTYWNRLGAGTKLMITDACHSGGLANLRGLTVRKRMPTQANSKGVSVVIAASGANEVSAEDEDLGQGVFTQVLLTGLRGNADANRDGQVDLAELSNFLKVKVPARAREVEGNQTPVIETHGAEAAGIKLTR
jgi:hypothetical protein